LLAFGAELRPGNPFVLLTGTLYLPRVVFGRFCVHGQGFASLRHHYIVTKHLREINAPKTLEQTNEKSFDDIAFS
jgi:hypothetical protein